GRITLPGPAPAPVPLAPATKIAARSRMPWTLRGRRQQGNAAAREEPRTTGSPPRRLAGASRLPAAARRGSETRNGSLGEAARRLPAGGRRIAVTITRPRPGVKDRMRAPQRHCSARDRRLRVIAPVLDIGRSGPLACTGTPEPGAARLERAPRFGGDPSAHRRTAAGPAHGAFLVISSSQRQHRGPEEPGRGATPRDIVDATAREREDRELNASAPAPGVRSRSYCFLEREGRSYTVFLVTYPAGPRQWRGYFVFRAAGGDGSGLEVRTADLFM